MYNLQCPVMLDLDPPELIFSNMLTHIRVRVITTHMDVFVRIGLGLGLELGLGLRGTYFMGVQNSCDRLISK